MPSPSFRSKLASTPKPRHCRREQSHGLRMGLAALSRVRPISSPPGNHPAAVQRRHQLGWQGTLPSSVCRRGSCRSSRTRRRDPGRLRSVADGLSVLPLPCFSLAACCFFAFSLFCFSLLIFFSLTFVTPAGHALGLGLQLDLPGLDRFQPRRIHLRQPTDQQPLEPLGLAAVLFPIGIAADQVVRPRADRSSDRRARRANWPRPCGRKEASSGRRRP